MKLNIGNSTQILMTFTMSMAAAIGSAAGAKRSGNRLANQRSRRLLRKIVSRNEKLDLSLKIRAVIRGSFLFAPN